MKLPIETRIENETSVPWTKSPPRLTTEPLIRKNPAGTKTASPLTLTPIDVPVTQTRLPETDSDVEIRNEDLSFAKDQDPWSTAINGEIVPEPMEPEIHESTISDYDQEPAMDQVQSLETVESEFATTEAQSVSKPVTPDPPASSPPHYNPRHPFHIAIVLLLLLAGSYGGFLWWELQPREVQPIAALSSNSLATDITSSQNNPAAETSSVPVTALEPKANSIRANTRRDGVSDEKTLRNQQPPEEARNTSAADHYPGNGNGIQTQPYAKSLANTNDGLNTNAIAQPATVIQLQKKYARPEIDPEIASAYLAFQTGKLDVARQEYEAVLQKDMRNRDALLALAAIDVRRGELDLAELRYQRILEIDPRDMHATAALLALHGRNSPLSESRIKSLLSTQPESAPLHFALGNLYAYGKRWPEAQSAYFRAYASDPDNADYAFNLAVSLDQLRQTSNAMRYYQRALDLSHQATGTSQVAFNPQKVLLRIRELQRN
jgi:tetratricopeptide (TPR) repeat protein